MLKVVVIDANAISRNLLSSVLVNGGFNVIGDANITSAGIAAMIKLQPQLVCIDLGGADDEAFARLATLREGVPKAVVFLVSAKFDAATVQTALERGVHGFIVKPFNAGNVIESIRKAILKLAHQHRQGPAQDSRA
ncbi:MAG TPA: response regulator [Noviherbaspirillum sp.]|uniref:ANTAR domain-containing response regulator n=1 Tax=Noviherbaspirillum sp. TaxID=1926288 RepID=UPI002D23806B|nr:response regulator [Noviherbaspirillum sp.]HYD94370.1 response regulator [Noviherbaspirillum sp.]